MDINLTLIWQYLFYLDVEKGDGEGKDGDGHEEEDGVDHGVDGGVGAPTLADEGGGLGLGVPVLKKGPRSGLGVQCTRARCQNGPSLLLPLEGEKLDIKRVNYLFCETQPPASIG